MTEKILQDPKKSLTELAEAQQQICEALEPLTSDARMRVLKAISILLDIPWPPQEIVES